MIASTLSDDILGVIAPALAKLSVNNFCKMLNTMLQQNRQKRTFFSSKKEKPTSQFSPEELLPERQDKEVLILLLHFLMIYK